MLHCSYVNLKSVQTFHARFESERGSSERKPWKAWQVREACSGSRPSLKDRYVHASDGSSHGTGSEHANLSGCWRACWGSGCSPALHRPGAGGRRGRTRGQSGGLPHAGQAPAADALLSLPREPEAEGGPAGRHGRADAPRGRFRAGRGRGAAGESLLLDRVSAGDAAERMPPEHEGEPLTAEQVGLLRDWIAAGAPAPADEMPRNGPARPLGVPPESRAAAGPARPAARMGEQSDRRLHRPASTSNVGLTPNPEASRRICCGGCPST